MPQKTSAAAFAVALTLISPAPAAMAADAATLARAGLTGALAVESVQETVRAPLAGHGSVAAQMERAGDRFSRHRKLVELHLALSREVADLQGARADVRRSTVERWPAERLVAANKRLTGRVAQLRADAEAASVVASVGSGTLEAIASCESGGDPAAVSSDGSYRGKYQFDYGTWASVGGSGDPAAAPESEQDMRAALLYQRAGASPWPVCGR